MNMYITELPVSIIITDMLVGYNTNISYKGTVYHVQTEDSGLRNPHIITLLYYKGTILSRKKTGYADVASTPDYKDKVRELMKEQHKAMIKELIAGRHTENTAAAPLAAEPIAEAVVEAPPVPSAPEPPAPEPAAPPEQKAEEPASDKRQIMRSLDDILLDYILKEEDR